MKKKIILSFAFILSLSPMLLNQYGGMKGVQEISGLVNILKPMGLLSLLLYFTGVWADFGKERIKKILCVSGTVGIVLAEIYEFFTWHVLTITGKVSLYNAVRFAFPEFYLGLLVSIIMIIIYFIIDKNIK